MVDNGGAAGNCSTAVQHLPAAVGLAAQSSQHYQQQRSQRQRVQQSVEIKAEHHGLGFSTGGARSAAVLGSFHAGPLPAAVQMPGEGGLMAGDRVSASGVLGFRGASSGAPTKATAAAAAAGKNAVRSSTGSGAATTEFELASCMVQLTGGSSFPPASKANKYTVPVNGDVKEATPEDVGVMRNASTQTRASVTEQPGCIDGVVRIWRQGKGVIWKSGKGGEVQEGPLEGNMDAASLFWFQKPTLLLKVSTQGHLNKGTLIQYSAVHTTLLCSGAIFSCHIHCACAVPHNRLPCSGRFVWPDIFLVQSSATSCGLF